MVIVRNSLVRCAIAVATVAILYGCESERPLPTRPSDPQVLPPAGTPQNQCGIPSYTISGSVRGEGGEPLPDAEVFVVPYPFGLPTRAQTDSSGRYNVCGPPASTVALQITKDHYATATKFDLPAKDQTIDFALYLRFQIPATGGTVTGVIRGDELGSDPFFGGVCGSTPCKIIDFDEQCPCPREVEITLRWPDQSSHLALYFSTSAIYLPPTVISPATRLCCSNPVVARYAFNFDFDRFLIGFEQALGAPPGHHDTQTFELTVRPIG